MVSSKGMLVNTGSTSKQSKKRSCCQSIISSTKWKESLTVNSLVVKGFKIGAKTFASSLSASIQGQQNWS